MIENLFRIVQLFSVLKFFKKHDVHLELFEILISKDIFIFVFLVRNSLTLKHPANLLPQKLFRGVEVAE